MFDWIGFKTKLFMPHSLITLGNNDLKCIFFLKTQSNFKTAISVAAKEQL